jgi:hypothetical protein
MRVNVGLATALVAAFMSQTALADDPPANTQAAPAAAPAVPGAAAAAEAKNAATPAGQQNAAAAESSSIKPGLTVSTAKPELTPEDKELIARGYKLEMRHGEKYFCRKEQAIGSRFETKQCDTAQSIEAHHESALEAMHSIESNRSRVSN